jgi:hypothetical protein
MSQAEAARAGTVRISRKSRARNRARIIANAALAALAALAMAANWTAARARARAGELLQDAGAALLQYTHAGHVDPARLLSVNGLPLRVLSGHTHDDLTTVLDAFDARCGRVDGGMSRRLATLAHGPFAPLRAAAPSLRPLVRGEHHGRGYLACLDLGAAELDPQQLLRRLQTFAAEMDVAAIGDLRFVWAQADPGGTAYVALWSEGPVRLAQLFPEHGDAPGVDPAAWPRPPRSRRLLSAHQQDATPLLAVYGSELAPAELHARYRNALIDGGFAVRESAGAGRWLIGTKGASTTAAVIRAAGPARSTVTVLPLR